MAIVYSQATNENITVELSVPLTSEWKQQVPTVELPSGGFRSVFGLNRGDGTAPVILTMQKNITKAGTASCSMRLAAINRTTVDGLALDEDCDVLVAWNYKPSAYADQAGLLTLLEVLAAFALAPAAGQPTTETLLQYGRSLLGYAPDVDGV